MVLSVLLLAPSIARPLEKVALPVAEVNPDGDDLWLRGGTTTIRYYNYCNGWTWAWSGWAPEERCGVFYQATQCGDNHVLRNSYHWAWVGSPAGYGYTGTMQLFAATMSRCPWYLIDSRPCLPSGADLFVWGKLVPYAPYGFVLLWTNGPAPGNPVAWATDCPAGPTGPSACGTCMPSARTTHSFLYGTASSPSCPPIAFQDGSACGAELLWSATGFFAEWVDPVLSAGEGVQTRTWSGVKSLYR